MTCLEVQLWLCAGLFWAPVLRRIFGISQLGVTFEDCQFNRHFEVATLRGSSSPKAAERLGAAAGLWLVILAMFKCLTVQNRG